MNEVSLERNEVELWYQEPAEFLEEIIPWWF